MKYSWHETLATLSTYGQSEKFQDLCNQLGQRLENEAGDIDAASLCYLCATNVEKTVKVWEAKAEEDSRTVGTQAALQTLVERVAVFLRALGPVKEGASRLGDSLAERLAQYAVILADQGRNDIAEKYAQIIAPLTAGKVVMDRLFHSTTSHPSGAVPPPFPFSKSDIASILLLIYQSFLCYSLFILCSCSCPCCRRCSKA